MTATAGGGEGVALARSIARSSRPAGSESERRARAECANFLRSRGFRVVEQSFEYSTLPGKWATPLAGACISLGGLWAARYVITQQFEMAQILTVAPMLVALMLGWVSKRRLALGSLRTGVNLVAERGVPRSWLVAHVDTKGQPVPLLTRALGVVLVAVGWLVTLGGWVAFAFDGTGAVDALVVGPLIAAVGGLPLAASVVLDRGTGALDNASGIACIFEAVDQLDPDFPIGVLVTTAEELALAGARAWAAGRPSGIALNCDGVDDEGETVCVMGRDRYGLLERAIDQAVAATGTRVQVRRSLPGVLFDSVALADAGWDTMTVTRGTVRSLARVHTPDDTLAAWQGRGVAGVAAFLAATTGAIVAEQHEARQQARHGDHPAGREE